ncbi:hypothetical protein GW17_00040082 [Ensete ventricosum]|nr:hypothetical protein GW17_00040082 [Ensete ventricosum]
MLSGARQELTRSFREIRREFADRLSGARWVFAGRMLEFVRSSPKEIGSSLGVHRKDAKMGPRREFDRRFTEGIGKLAGSTPGDHRKKSGSLIARMPEVTGLVEVGS